MVKSMTGYGRGETVRHGRSYVVEVRAVNNRYLDCTVKLPRAYTFAEDALRKTVQGSVGRGKLDVLVTVDDLDGGETVVTLNEGMVRGYCAAMRKMVEEYGVRDDISASVLAKMPDVFTVEKAAEDRDALACDLKETLEAALAEFDRMREREGEKLKADLLGKLDRIEELTGQVERRSPVTVAEYREKLEKRMAEVLADKQIDESRILTEAAIFADKVAVDEETVRLRSHLEQFRGMLASGGPVGRKLDFLIQEMNRETNTIGSKGNDLELARCVVEMKAEIEKVREQVQNLE